MVGAWHLEMWKYHQITGKLHARCYLNAWGCQVVRHVWVSTKGGKEPRPLNPDVVVGAANVGSVRRLRNMVHGAVAMQRVSQNGAAQKPPDAAQLQRQYSRAHKAQAANIEKSRGYRCCRARAQLDVAWRTLDSRVFQCTLCYFFVSTFKVWHDSGVRANVPCSHSSTVIQINVVAEAGLHKAPIPCATALRHQLPAAC